MTARFAGRVAFVTGGASGIGQAAVEGFARDGASVVVADIDLEKAATVAAAAGGHAVALDVADEPSWTRAIAQAMAHFGGIDFVANVAGISHASSLGWTSIEDWNRVVGVNQTGTFLGCKHGLAAIDKTGRGGAIVNLSSVQGVHAQAELVAYNATKAAVRMISKTTALSGALFKPAVRCNTVIPGYVDTPMMAPLSVLFGSRERMVEAMARDVPLGRLCAAQDIANAILFLCSDEAAMITGAEIAVDGGLTIPMPMTYLSAL
jgi:NAD(P)-dependent dehydrogenase (short-subunit alcohol dehydrogenase family)